MIPNANYNKTSIQSRNKEAKLSTCTIGNFILLVLLAVCMNSCSWLMIGIEPSRTSNKYYSKKFILRSDAVLKTDGFYCYKFIGETSKEVYYSYLRFYTDGRINSMTTKDTPENIKEDYWAFNGAYGYYKLENDSIAYELKSRYGTYVHCEGKIHNNEIALKILDKRSNGDTTYFCKYLFHEGFAK